MSMSFCLARGVGACVRRVRVYRISQSPDAPSARIVPDTIGKRPKRGRKPLFNATIHALRLCVERTFAWEDKFKRLLLRFECIQQRHYGMQVMAYTLINLRAFCGV